MTPAIVAIDGFHMIVVTAVIEVKSISAIAAIDGFHAIAEIELKVYLENRWL